MLMFAPTVDVAVKTAASDRRPITDGTARDIAKTLKLALWQHEHGTPLELQEFIEDGGFTFTSFRSALDNAAKLLGVAPDTPQIHALLRYADHHQGSGGRRGSIAGWATL